MSRKQSRRMSLVEAIVNVAVGYAVAVLTQILVFPLFGLQIALGANLAIGGVFTIVSICRSYLLRRVFEAIRVHRGDRRHTEHQALPLVRARADV